MTNLVLHVPNTFLYEKVKKTTVKPYWRKMTTRGKSSGLDVLLIHISHQDRDQNISATFPKSQEIHPKLVPETNCSVATISSRNADSRNYSLGAFTVEGDNVPWD